MCCTKLDPLLRDCKFIIHTDHKNLTYMKSSPSSMVGRWSMALQELDYTIAYVRGSENTVADAMSRLCANLSDLVIKVRPETTGTELDNLPSPFCGALKIIPDMTDEQRDALHMCHNKFVGHGVVVPGILGLRAVPDLVTIHPILPPTVHVHPYHD